MIKQSAHHLNILTGNMNLALSLEYLWPLQSLDLNPEDLFWYVEKQELHSRNVWLMNLKLQSYQHGPNVVESL